MAVSNARDETAEERARVVAFYRERGLAATYRETGIPKSTIKRWAEAAAVPPAEANSNAISRTAAATEVATATLKQRTAEAKAALVPKLAAIAHQALDSQLAMMRAKRQVEEAAARNSGIARPELVLALATVTAGVDMRDIVGMGTRAIHDLQLLIGEDTERGAAGVVVVFAQQEQPVEQPKIVELPPVQHALTR